MSVSEAAGKDAPAPASEAIFKSRQAIETTRHFERGEFVDDLCELVDIELTEVAGTHAFSRHHIKQTILTEAFLAAVESEESEDYADLYEVVTDSTLTTLQEANTALRDYLREPAPELPRSTYRYKIPSSQEQKELIARAQAGDKEAEAKVVASCLRFVHKKHIQERLHRRPLPKHIRGVVDVEDEAQIAASSMLTSIHRFTAQRGTTYLTYANHQMRNDISRERMKIGSTIRVPVHVQERIQCIQSSATQNPEDIDNPGGDDYRIIDHLSNDPSPRLRQNDIFQTPESFWGWVISARNNFVDAPLERVELDDVADYAPSHNSFAAEGEEGVVELSEEHWLASLDPEHDDYDSEETEESLPYPIMEAPAEEEENLAIRREGIRNLHMVMQETLSSKEREILRLRYAGELTYQEIGDRFDLSRESIRAAIEQSFTPLRRPDNAILLRDITELARDHQVITSSTGRSGGSTGGYTGRFNEEAYYARVEALTDASEQRARQLGSSVLHSIIGSETFTDAHNFLEALEWFGALGDNEMLVATGVGRYASDGIEHMQLQRRRGQQEVDGKNDAIPQASLKAYESIFTSQEMADNPRVLIALGMVSLAKQSSWPISLAEIHQDVVVATKRQHA